MFREMRRKKQELPRQECFELLGKEKRGVLAVLGDGGYPYAVPVNFYFDAVEEKIYIHGAKEGHKIDAIRACDKVCFTVYEQGVQDTGDWSYHVRSVVVMGRAEFVSDEDLAFEKARAMGLKYYPSAAEVDEELRKDFRRVQMLAITPEHMTGKRVHEK